MKVFSILFLAFFIALFNKAHSFCATGSLHADLTQAVVRSSDWMRTFYKNNETFIEPYTASSMIETLRLAGHQPRYLLSEFKNKDQLSIDETLKDYLDRENGTNGNLTKIPTGQLAYIVQGVIAICRKPEAFEGFNLYDSLHDGLKWFKKTPTFNNYFQYSLVAIAFCTGGVQVPEVMVKELVKAARQKYSIHSVDTNALILMALSCVKNSSMSNEVNKEITKIVDHLISKQNTATGAFGNQYSTALAVQALQAARHVYTNTWHCEKAMRNILGYQDEDGSFGNILANVQVTPSLLGESLISLSKFMCTTPPSPPKKNITVSVNLVFNATATEPTVKVTTLEGTTAYEILELASKQNPCYKAEYKKYSFGRSITSICGVRANAKEGLYWFIYVDGSLAKYGVDDLKPKDGSLLTFKYQKYKAPAATQSTAFEKNITVSVNLVFNATTTEPTVKVTTLEGTTTYVILELASKQNPCYKAEYKKYSFGRSITSICGVKANAKEGLNWFIYVDGSLAKYGVDNLRPKDGSFLSFKYQKNKAPTTTQNAALVKSNSTTNGVSGYGIPAFARIYLMVYFIIYLIH